MSFGSQPFDEDCRLILCEGKSDAAFLSHLLDHHEIDGFRIEYPVGGITAEGDGKDAFGSYLAGAVTRPGFHRHVARIVVVADHDSRRSFNDVVRQIPTDDYGIPTAVEEFSVDADKTNIAVLLLPREPTGVLEDVIVSACDWESIDCLNEYQECVGLRDWSSSKIAKMRLRCIIAATCSRNPECSTSYMWSDQNPDIPIAISHANFNWIAEFFRTVP